MKKALIFDPYLDTLGGGEFYSLSVGEFLLENNFSLEIAWDNKDILEKINQRFGINLKNRVKITPKALLILKNKKNLLGKYLFTRNYDLIFFVSDASVPFLFAKKNWLLFQAPFTNVDGDCLLNQLKLKKINKVICYSFFVKKFIDEEFKINSWIIYPPIADKFFHLKPVKKENIILSVGRFDQIMNAKKQDVLIDAFKQLVDNGLKNWRLVLIGGLRQENQYFKRLRQLTTGYPIRIMTNIDFKTLVDYYQHAKIYWHATGFEEDLNKHPKRAEHFGISIVEAMSCGVVPVVFNGGGIPEILAKDSQRLLWSSLGELVQKTQLLIKNSELWKKTSQQVKKRAFVFNRSSFFEKLSYLLF